jgi:hypothetical protein
MRLRRRSRKRYPRLQAADRQSTEARETFPRFSRENLFRMVSDVMGRLEMLEDGGIVARGEGDPLTFIGLPESGDVVLTECHIRRLY